MVDDQSFGDLDAFALAAGTNYSRAIDLNGEDFQLRALKYPLLRLSEHGVTEQDRNELVDLAKDIIEERDVTKACETIAGRKSASPIAVAIARIVASARGSQWTAMLGGVVGAHAALSLTLGQQADIAFDVLGAIVGAACLDSAKFVQEAIGTDVKAFVERDIA